MNLKTPYNIDRFGNTSGGSIPLLMTTELAEKLPNERLTLMACGFGVGLSWGSVCFTTDRTVCLPLIYI